MNEEIKEDCNCIVRAFENNNVSILNEKIDNKKKYYFKASDIAKILNIINIRTSIQNYDEDEKVVRKSYDIRGCEQDTTFLSSQGVYRLLYNSKKETAKKFRKWAGNILDDIIFNESKELNNQLKEYERKLEEHKLLLDIQIDKGNIDCLLVKEKVLIETHLKQNVFYVCLFLYEDKWYIKFGISQGAINIKYDISHRITAHKNEISKDLYLVHIINIENCKDLENRFKQKVILTEKKFRNGDNKTEIIELTDKITKESVIELANKLSKEPVQDNFEKERIQLEMEKEKTKQMEIQLEILKLNKPDNVDENVGEEKLFCNWLDNNIENKNGEIVIWKDLIFLYLNKNVASNMSVIYKNYFENYINKKYNIVVEYKGIRRPNTQSVRGYRNFKLK